MASNKLDDGFEEVPLTPELDEGFEPVEESSYGTKDLLHDVQDTGMGVAQGVSLGGADELVGGLKAGYDVVTGQADPTKDLAGLYRKYQELTEGKFKEAQERSPYLYGAGEIGGAVGTGLMSSGMGLGLKSAVKGAGMAGLAKNLGVGALEAAPLGIVQGGLSSEGALVGATPEQQEQVLADSAMGGATGSVLGAGIKGLSGLVPEPSTVGVPKFIQDKIEDVPFLRQIVKAKEYGEQGINLGSEKARIKGSANAGPFGKIDHEATVDIVNRIKTVDKDLGKAVGMAIDDATNNGVTIDIGPELRTTADSLERFFSKDPSIDSDAAVRNAYMKMLIQTGKPITPTNVKSVLDEMGKILDKLEGDTSYHGNITRTGVNNFMTGLKNKLNQAVPAYQSAAKRFAEFRAAVPETILRGNIPEDMSNLMYGSLNNKEEKLYKATRSMIEGATHPGGQKAAETEKFINLMNSLNEMEYNNPALLQKMGFNTAQDAENLIKGYADDSAMLQQTLGKNPQEGGITALKSAGLGLGSTGRGLTLSGANKYGLYKEPVKKIAMAPVKLSKKLYTATDQQLGVIAQQLQGVPGLKSIGQTLERGLQNKDTAARNSSIFVILQNPEARKLLNDNEDPSQIEE